MNKMILFFLFLMWSIMIFLFFMMLTNYLHPSLLMIILIFMSIILNLNMSMWKSNFLYSMMLFLIMISGMLIIFLYFTSLISNEQMKLFLNKFIFSSFMLNLIFLIYNLSFNFSFNNPSPHHFNENNPIYMINEKYFKNILSMYEYPFNNFTISCMFFLLITLFSIIKICSFKSSTLRKIN